jgi:hypothetical protein
MTIIEILMLAKSWAVREWVPQSRKAANSLTDLSQMAIFGFAICGESFFVDLTFKNP